MFTPKNIIKGLLLGLVLGILAAAVWLGMRAYNLYVYGMEVRGIYEEYGDMLYYANEGAVISLILSGTFETEFLPRLAEASEAVMSLKPAKGSELEEIHSYLLAAVGSVMDAAALVPLSFDEIDWTSIDTMYAGAMVHISDALSSFEIYINRLTEYAEWITFGFVDVGELVRFG